MVAGHLQEKKGFYYIVLDYKDEVGKRKKKWISTSLQVKGNKKKAEALLMDARRNFCQPNSEEPSILSFADFMEHWLEVAKQNVDIVTYSSYSNAVKGVIVPHFREHDILLAELQPKDIQDFYMEQLMRVSANSVIHYHANIHKALKYAVKMGLISTNPADQVECPKKNRFVGNFYDSDELNELFAIVRGTKIELAVMFGTFYGLRRSEIVGLKWDAIDFKANTFTIRHIVTTVNLDGKSVTIAKDRTKNSASFRKLPLAAPIRTLLLQVKQQQEAMRMMCGRSYNSEYLDYIYVDQMGTRIRPDYISKKFNTVLKQNGLRHIRFHDLRHSCASLLLDNGVSMKQIQEWLGHANFSTTANIYAHLDFNSKISSANAMLIGLGMLPQQIPDSCQQNCV